MLRKYYSQYHGQDACKAENGHESSILIYFNKYKPQQHMPENPQQEAAYSLKTESYYSKTGSSFDR